MKIETNNMRLVDNNGIHRLYAKDIDTETAQYYQVDETNEVVYSFKGKISGEKPGLVPNTIALTEYERRFRQPKYFHTDENMLIRDWYIAAFPSDTWGAGCINANAKFKDWTTEFKSFEPDDPEFGETYIVDSAYRTPVRFDDSIVEYRVRKELEVASGLSFGYTLED